MHGYSGLVIQDIIWIRGTEVKDSKVEPDVTKTRKPIGPDSVDSRQSTTRSIPAVARLLILCLTLTRSREKPLSLLLLDYKTNTRDPFILLPTDLFFCYCAIAIIRSTPE